MYFFFWPVLLVTSDVMGCTSLASRPENKFCPTSNTTSMTGSNMKIELVLFVSQPSNWSFQIDRKPKDNGSVESKEKPRTIFRLLFSILQVLFHAVLSETENCQLRCRNID